MREILSLAVMACVVFGASLTSINTNYRKTETSAKRQVSDDEIIIILGNIGLPYQQSQNPKPKPKPAKNIPKCTTKECNKQSMSMSRMMDKTADPCEDFYEYACGGWLAKGQPGDHAKWTIFSKMGEETENKLRELIEKQKDSDNSVGKLVYNWYASCMDQEERNRLGAKPLKDLIHDIAGKQFNPFVANDFYDKDWKLEDVLATIHRNLDVFPLFKPSLGIDPRNSSSPMRLSIGQSEPLMKSRDLYLSQEKHAASVAKAYMALMGTLTRLLGATEHQDVSSIIQELKQILLFEVEEVKVMTDESKEEENKIITWTMKEFQANLPGFDWIRYFNKLMEGLSDNPFTETEEVFVESPKYLTDMMNTLKNTSTGVIGNYLTWSIIYHYGPYLSSEFHDAYMAFARIAYGIKKSSELWRRCVRGTDDSIDMGVSMLYVTDKDSGITNESMHRADQMVQNIREAFIENLETVTWMDSITKQAAREKAEAMFQQIGYPDFITNTTLLEEYFSGLKADPKNIFKNRLTENKIRMKNTLLARGSPVNRYRWDMKSTEINAYYSPQSNKIVVPAGILRPPFYHFEHPHAENFGAIGFVVGHELTHGFDSSGGMFDKKGNLANWWDRQSMAGFVVREKCLEDQYQQYTVLGHHLDGKKTLGENTADNGGAYHKWLAENDHDSTLPNLGLNSNQLFFLSFAQIWCDKATPNYQLTDLQLNEHSPGKYRVDGTLKNNLDFADAFSCPLGSPMNPVRKCEVW
ncbi:Endothelin-converting enzyme 2 [Desmophyllum pertusum]|uniref:Endothelin-converting enzyme 2 n=1 Tax=Desmophyllum pertusum TaxID=174260 RepID=A0A9X0DCD3_9CNID|nr:Endothelin-converting enzyme 2 [Desmophyllum pertusum]